MLKLSIVFLVVFAGTAGAQAMVEYGLGAGKAATTTAPASGAAGVFDSLLDRLKNVVQGTKPSTTSSTPSQASSTPPDPAKTQRNPRAAAMQPAVRVAAPRPDSPPPPVYEDSRGIQAGMGYEELIRRFGPPSVAVTESPHTRTMWYSGKDGRVQLQLQGDKVVSVQPRQLPQTAVMLPG